MSTNTDTFKLPRDVCILCEFLNSYHREMDVFPFPDNVRNIIDTNKNYIPLIFYFITYLSNAFVVNHLSLTGKDNVNVVCTLTCLHTFPIRKFVFSWRVQLPYSLETLGNITFQPTRPRELPLVIVNILYINFFHGGLWMLQLLLWNLDSSYDVFVLCYWEMVVYCVVIRNWVI